MALLSVLYPLVRMFVSNAPDPAMDDAIRVAARDFCRESKFLRRTLVLSTLANELLYVLASDIAQTEVFEVKAVQLGVDPLKPTGFEDVPQQAGSSLLYIFEPPADLWLTPTQEIAQDSGLAVRVVLQTTMDCTLIPDYLLNKFEHGIAEGAIARLKAMKDRSWADPAGVGYHQDRYRREIATASADASRTHRARNFRVRSWA